MLLKSLHLPRLVPGAILRAGFVTSAAKRALVTLAIESSCDDTSVAVVEKRKDSQALLVHYHEKVTSNNLAYRGIHPLVAQDSHEQNLARLVAAAIAKLPPRPDGSAGTNNAHNAAKPDFVTVTRGPGMRASLNVGLNTAKGLAVAWQVPLVGVNHMQAHALTPRLVSAMARSSSSSPSDPLRPRFPFMSLLVSGGHTLLLHSSALCAHRTLATTNDIAAGDAIDKIARAVLPPEVFAASTTTMYGPLLEAFAFEPPVGSSADSPRASGGSSSGNTDFYAYEAPATRHAEMQMRVSRWGWGFTPVFAASAAGAKARSLEYSFAGLCSAVERTVERAAAAREVTVVERREMAREAMRIAFEHLASRVVLGLEQMGRDQRDGGGSDENKVDTLVVSGGVAANGYLRHILREFLDARDYKGIELVFPPLELCTDNALMIGWTGIEMFEAGWASELSCQSLRKWSLDPAAEEGGIFGVGGWRRLDASAV